MHTDPKYTASTPVIDPSESYPRLPQCGVILPEGALTVHFGRHRAIVSTSDIGHSRSNEITIHGVAYNVRVDFTLTDGQWAVSGKTPSERYNNVYVSRMDWNRTPVSHAARERAQATAYAALMAVLEEYPGLPTRGELADWFCERSRAVAKRDEAKAAWVEAEAALDAVLMRDPRQSTALAS
jgi:hypothetical protein